MVLDKYERDCQANVFARALLMPSKQFKEKAWECYDEDTETFNTKEIARYFNVSVTDAHIRGVELGLFRGDWE